LSFLDPGRTLEKPKDHSQVLAVDGFVFAISGALTTDVRQPSQQPEVRKIMNAASMKNAFFPTRGR
jgi:hypothetical protein